MSLDVETPEPPELETDTDPNAYDDVDVSGANDTHRDDLDAFLREGAWDEAFAEWAAQSDLDESEWAIVLDLDLLSRFDFFWDDFADRVGYHAPGLPEDWKERDLHPDLDSWSTVSAINAELTELGRIVSERLKADYVDWDADYEAPDDLPDF
ncbi:hypothetical protein J2752_000233 [Halarchaeum rubridurum]|uniref:DUF7992 domain-containing protein n=1 Tax=Halarchaeum rubridurum TaxID=489911 RepID=A0A830FN27_9EURY|nr:hypothetical protein [Halarchaeum rubridurum]MBP1953352.1 hypothetical protein [Halarchaeum rubridurum]GGM65948.1 hypothetical protein GCM10009017_15060 [Halarchaeum rubridurum]